MSPNPNCPYPPSDPFCNTTSTSPTPTTEPNVQHVIVDNQQYNFQAGVQSSVDDVKTAVQHAESAMIVGFIVVCLVIALIGALIANVIAGLNNKPEETS
jgi:hypothetical protein